MKKQYSLLSILLAFLLVFSACKDKDDDPKGFDSKLLVGKNWKISGHSLNGSSDFSTWEPCSKDDVWVFRENKEFEWNEGATKCDPADDQVFFTGTWDLKENKLSLDGDEMATVEELTATSLRIKFEEDGDVETFTFTAM